MASTPGSAAGRSAGRLALASLTLVAAYAGLAAWMVAATPEDGDPSRALFIASVLVLYAAVLAGLVAAVAVCWAFFKHHDRSRTVKAVLGASAGLGLLLIVFIVSDIFSGTHGRYAVVRVDLARRDAGVEYQKAAEGPIDVVIRVTNSESVDQLVAVMELKPVDANGATATPLRANSFPLVDGVVRHYTYPGEGQVVFWTTETAVSFAIVQGAQPPPRPATLSRVVKPGETWRLHLPGAFPAGTRFVIFSDVPGDYAAGHWVDVALH